ncbi:MAG: hypothetical protein KGR26_00135 [Cyanobacteria bacterium REEB65]|nr:hypothetical protein [Cyanobacteria bacterium REEB65]
MTWSAALPMHHRQWLELVLPGELWGERRATCHDCVMCRAGQGPTGPRFSPHTKCCTYLPELANFLVGQVLETVDSPGRRSVVERIMAREAVTPLGLGKTRAFLDDYAPQSFGVRDGLRCPHYLSENGGMCGIWQQRNAICATWFCHYDRGAVAKRFWAATSRFLSIVEQRLARWCARQVDPALAAEFPPMPTVPGKPQTAADPSSRPAAWGTWAGREQDFYRACAARWAALSPARQLELAGAEAQLAAMLVRDAFADRQTQVVPDPLTQGEITVKADLGHSLLVETYSPFDPLELPAELVAALACFDGKRSNAEALAMLQESHRLEISGTRLQELVDFGALRPARSAIQDVADALAALRSKLAP